MIERFADDEQRRLLRDGVDHEQLVARRKDLEDHPIPAGNSSAAYGLLRLAALTGEHALRGSRASRPPAAPRARAEHPQAFGHLLQALDFRLAQVGTELLSHYALERPQLVADQRHLLDLGVSARPCATPGPDRWRRGSRAPPRRGRRRAGRGCCSRRLRPRRAQQHRVRARRVRGALSRSPASARRLAAPPPAAGAAALGGVGALRLSRCDACPGGSLSAPRLAAGVPVPLRRPRLVHPARWRRSGSGGCRDVPDVRRRARGGVCAPCAAARNRRSTARSCGAARFGLVAGSYFVGANNPLTLVTLSARVLRARAAALSRSCAALAASPRLLMLPELGVGSVRGRPSARWRGPGAVDAGRATRPPGGAGLIAQPEPLSAPPEQGPPRREGRADPLPLGSTASAYDLGRDERRSLLWARPRCRRSVEPGRHHRRDAPRRRAQAASVDGDAAT